MKVREIMTEPPVTCTEGTSVAVAARLMSEADYGTLPVVDARRGLVGIVTDRDICLALARTNRNALNIFVREVTTIPVTSALADEDVHVALGAMRSARVRRLPVRDAQGRLAGMLSIEDVIVRGLEADGINPGELIAALRAMYVRTPATVTTAIENGFMPG